MFENKIDETGAPICPVDKRPIFPPSVASRPSEAVMTPTGLWIIHKSCIEEWNARAELIREFGVSDVSVPNQRPSDQQARIDYLARENDRLLADLAAERRRRAEGTGTSARAAHSQRARRILSEDFDRMVEDWTRHQVFTVIELKNKLSAYRDGFETSAGAVHARAKQLADRGVLLECTLAAGRRAFMKL